LTGASGAAAWVARRAGGLACDALVAAWLPGSEGEGVADPLFGRTGYTGRLPVTWPKTLAQEPINVGDPNYDPLFPFGYGLRNR
jgi:beta-glucosidase